ncbi:helix-turn-helix domain-containing protein [Patescibacteria group bacterium]|nr:helix-turn-helix domain-containing protein [Patescibacteria group bacterium]
MKKFKHLSLMERELLYGWRKEKVSLREIGRRLGRDHTSLSDELKRNLVVKRKIILCSFEG